MAVAQGGHVGGAGGRGPEQGADLGDPPGDLDLVVEDVAPGAAADEALELFVDAGAGGVDQVHDRGAGRVGEFLDAGDLLEGPLAPGAGLDGVVVGDDAHRPARHGPHSAEMMLSAGGVGFLIARGRRSPPGTRSGHRVPRGLPFRAQPGGRHAGRRRRHRRRRVAGRTVVHHGQRLHGQGRLLGREDRPEDHAHPGEGRAAAGADALLGRRGRRAHLRADQDLPRPLSRRPHLLQRGAALRRGAAGLHPVRARRRPAPPTCPR